MLAGGRVEVSWFEIDAEHMSQTDLRPTEWLAFFLEPVSVVAEVESWSLDAHLFL